MIYTHFFPLYVGSPYSFAMLQNILRVPSFTSFITHQWNKLVLLNKQWTQKKTITNPDYEYYRQNKQLLNRFFTMVKNSVEKNTNIDPEFYNKSKFQNIMKVESNFIEKKWSSRILMVNTPRGNIIMFYDAYKQGFAYYSDSNGIPYNIINAVAMKYVTKFRCADFFVDNQITQEISRRFFKDKLNLENLVTFDSILIPIYFEDKEEKAPEKKRKVLIPSNNYPFVKYKTNHPTTQEDISSRIDKIYSKNVIYKVFKYMHYIHSCFHRFIGIFYKTTPKIKQLVLTTEKEYISNKFIYMGKVSNFHILQKPVKKNALNGFQSDLLSGIKLDTTVQKQLMHYSDYKKLIETSQHPLEF